MVLISVHYCLVIELASLSGWYCPSLTPGGGGGSTQSGVGTNCSPTF